MFVYTASLFLLPCLVLLWTIDFYLVVTCFRLFFGSIRAGWASRAAGKLSPITDPLRNAVRRGLERQAQRRLPAWSSWLMIIASGLLMRHALVLTILLLSSTKGASS